LSILFKSGKIEVLFAVVSRLGTNVTSGGGMPKTVKPKPALLEFACPYDDDKNLPKLREQCKKPQQKQQISSNF
jgi:hypothetical protein